MGQPNRHISSLTAMLTVGSTLTPADLDSLPRVHWEATGKDPLGPSTVLTGVDTQFQGEAIDSFVARLKQAMAQGDLTLVSQDAEGYVLQYSDTQTTLNIYVKKP